MHRLKTQFRADDSYLILIMTHLILAIAKISANIVAVAPMRAPKTMLLSKNPIAS